MDKIKIKNVFVAVFDKKVLDSLVPLFKYHKINCVGTQGTVKYLKTKGVGARSVVSGFDFDGRVKSLDKKNFVSILADKANPKHLKELKKLKILPTDAVIVDLYKPTKKGFPESMDIGGQALIRAAIKNFDNVAVAFDKKSIDDLAWELKQSKGETGIKFRHKQAKAGLKFVSSRTRLESSFAI